MLLELCLEQGAMVDESKMKLFGHVDPWHIWC